MAQQRTENRNDMNIIGYWEALMDVVHRLAFILLVALGIGLLAWVRADMSYQPVYTSTTVMTVHQTGMDRSSFMDSSNASNAADKFSAILNSNVLRKKVAEELGMPAFSGTTSAKVINKTNIINISVSAGTPELAFREMKGVLENYDIVSSRLMGNLNLTTLQAPTIPKEPDNASPGLRRGLQAGGVTAVVLAFLFFVISLTRDTIRTESDVHHKLKVKLLVSIMHEKKYKARSISPKKRQKPVLISDDAVSFYYVETVRRLARRVRDILDEKQAKTLLVSSVRAHEGKSTVSVNLALALAEEKKTVILVDGDLRKPSLYQILDIPEDEIRDYGDILVSQMMQDKTVDAPEDIAGYLVKKGSLYCLLNTSPVAHATEAVSAGRFRHMLEKLKEKADYIIVDSSPVALAADSEEMVHAVDQTAIVVHQHLVEAREINDTIDILEDGKNRKFIGCIFNDVRHAGGVQVSGYRYGYGHYGHGYSHYGRDHYYGYHDRYDRYSRYGRYGRDHYSASGRRHDSGNGQQDGEDKT